MPYNSDIVAIPIIARKQNDFLPIIILPMFTILDVAFAGFTPWFLILVRHIRPPAAYHGGSLNSMLEPLRTFSRMMCFGWLQSALRTSRHPTVQPMIVFRMGGRASRPRYIRVIAPAKLPAGGTPALPFCQFHISGFRDNPPVYDKRIEIGAKPFKMCCEKLDHQDQSIEIIEFGALQVVVSVYSTRGKLWRAAAFRWNPSRRLTG